MDRHPLHTRRDFLAFAGAGALVGLSGCQIQKKTTANASMATATQAIPADSFEVQQYALIPMKDDKPANVFVREPFLIIYTQNQLAYVLDLQSLAVKWVAQMHGEGTSIRPPVVLKDYVVFPTITSLEVFDHRGKNRRSVSTRGTAIRSGAAGEGTFVYFGGDQEGGGRLVSIDLAGSQYQSASVHWQLSTRGGISATPAVHKGIVYVGDDQGGVYAVNEDNRKPAWALSEEHQEADVFHTGGRIRADLRVDDACVYVASMDTRLYALDRTKGRIVWRYFGGTPLLHNPEVTATSVYTRVDGVGVVSIEKGKGDTIRPHRWAVKEGTRFLAEDGKHAYLETTDHGILAVDLLSGQSRFKSKRRDYVAMGLSPRGNTIYTITPDGTLRAVMPVFTAGKVGERA